MKNIATRKPDKLDRGRGRMANPVVVRRHFTTLQKVLQDNGLLDRPDQIFNVDEAGLNLELRKGKVIVDRQQKHAYSTAKGGCDHVTANYCASPGRALVPPFIIFEKSFPSGDYVANGPPGAMYGKSENGYMDDDLLFKWFN